MSINFATLQGLTIPEGVVTQIADASGKVLWKLANDKPIILEVEKITSDTYAGETAYTGEQFILLDIYPKKNGTVTVTYGGLTKTITDTSGVENPNAQKVFFGTFNGVSDSVTTPTSGTLIIEGGCSNFACASYQNTSKATSSKYCGCITGVTDWGNIESIMDNAFRECLLLTSINIPNSITTIGSYAFYGCTNLVIESLPNSITNISSNAFYSCTNLSLKSLPSGLKTIGDYAFYSCTSVDYSRIPDTVISIGAYAFNNTTNNVNYLMHKKKVTISSSVQSIGAYAFASSGQSSSGGTYYSCALSEVVMLATTPPTLGADAFGTCSGTMSACPSKFTVPIGSGDAYKTAEVWNNYASKNLIVEAS